ncbi:unnamed protein product [Bathycoccus prasinos]
MFSLATTPHETVWNSFSCKGARHRGRKQSSKRAYVRSAAKADEDDTKDPVQETFKKLYAPNSGKRIKYGVFQETMSASEKNAYTDEEKTNLRRKAAEELTVIDKEERKRRGTVGRVFASATALAAVLQVFVFPQPIFARVALFPMVYLSYGFLASERSGM